MNTTIKYLRKVPIWKLILGIAGLAVGLFGVLSFNLFSLVPLLFGLMFLKTEGSEIDLHAKKYRKVNAVLGLKTGKWEALPNPEYISVFSTTEDTTIRALSAETTNSSPIIILNLFYNGNHKIEIFKTQNKAEAFNTASHIAQALLTDILDATTPGDFKWIDKNAYLETGNIVHID